MREIKYRGKAIDGSRMIYGEILHNNFSTFIVSTVKTMNRVNISSMTYNEVEMHTVGQFTNLTDKNNVEIYEGDIVRCDVGEGRFENRVVCYATDQAKYKTVPKSTYHNNAGNGGWTGYDLRGDCEVVGNVFDHPKLIN